MFKIYDNSEGSVVRNSNDVFICLTDTKDDAKNIIKALEKQDYNENIEEKMTFEDAFDMCPIEMQIKYDYLDELLCEIDDEMMYLTKEIEKAKVDEEVAEKMWDNGFNSAREELVQVNRERVELNRRYDYLFDEYKIVMDLYDEMLINVLKNIE